MLLNLTVADRAFAVLDLTEPEQLFRLRVPPGLNELEVPIKNLMMEMPLFRSWKRSHRGNEVSDTTKLTNKWIRERMKYLGEVTGFVLPVGPYCFRRGNGEALDSSSMYLAGL